MNNLSKAREIVFIDSIKQADDYFLRERTANAPAARPDDRIIITLTPSVAAYIKDIGYDPNDTMPYLSTDSHKRILEKSEEIMRWLRQNLKFVDLGIGVHESYPNSFIFYARLAVHYCLAVTEIIFEAIGIHEPDKLTASLAKSSTQSLHMHDDENYFGILTQTIAQKNNLSFETISKTTCRRNLFCELADTAKIALKCMNMRLWVAMILAKQNMNPLRRPIAFTTTHYQMDRLSECLKTEFSKTPFYVIKSPLVVKSVIPTWLIAALWGRYLKKIDEQAGLFEAFDDKIDRARDIFSYRGIYFGDIISQKLKSSIYPYTIGEMLWSLELEGFMDKAAPAAILCGGSRLDETALAEMCPGKGTISIGISHGSLVAPKNKYEMIEWGEQGRTLFRIPFSFVALQTPLSEGYLHAFPSASKTLKTGPLTWGRPMSEEAGKKAFDEIFGGRYQFKKVKVIIHAGTAKSCADFRPYIYETLDEYIHSIRTLAEAVEPMPDTLLVVRFRPRSGITVESLKRLVPFSEKVRLSFTEPFLDVLAMSDLLVSYSSTAIEEAIQNRITVLLYGGKGRYRHVPAVEISSHDIIPKAAAYHVKDDAYLEHALRGILRQTKDPALFDPYVYPSDERVKLANFLKESVGA